MASNKKQIFKLINKCIAVMMPLILVCLYSKFFKMWYIDDESVSYIWNKDVTNTTHDKKYNVLILGDSTSNSGYCPEVLSDDTLMLSFGGSTVIEGYYVLSDYLKHNEAPEHLIVTYNDGGYWVDAWYWLRVAYSHRFNPIQTAEIMINAVKYQDDYILNDRYSSNKFIENYVSYQFYLPNKYDSALLNSKFIGRKEANDLAYKTVNTKLGHYLNIYNDEGLVDEEVYNEEFVHNPLYDMYLTKLMDKCSENGIAVHFIKPPFTKTKTYSDEYINDYEEYFERICQEYDGIADFKWYRDYTAPDSWYIDNLHMNNHGSFNFSLMVRDDYPEVFANNEVSAERMSAVNFDIANENYMGELFRRTNGLPYTVLVIDSSDSAVEGFYGFLADGSKEIYEAHNQLEGIDTAVFYVNDAGVEPSYCKINTTKEGLSFECENFAPVVVNIEDVNKTTFVILDDYNKKVVCAKSSKYSVNGYEKLEWGGDVLFPVGGME